MDASSSSSRCEQDAEFLDRESWFWIVVISVIRLSLNCGVTQLREVDRDVTHLEQVTKLGHHLVERH